LQLLKGDEKCFVKKNNQDKNWKVMENLSQKKTEVNNGRLLSPFIHQVAIP
jgi:hypothetical protein